MVALVKFNADNIETSQLFNDTARYFSQNDFLFRVLFN